MTTEHQSEPHAAVPESTESLKKQADAITKRRSMYAAGAGLLPFPLLDTAVILGIQVTMIRSISQLYHLPFKENLVKSIIGSLAGTLGTVSVVKAIPGMGTIIGGVTAATTAAAFTYALGKVFTQHFDQGGTLLDFDPVKSREFFFKEFEAGRMLTSDVAEVEKEVEKEKAEKKGLLNLFGSKKSKQKETDKQELVQTNKDIMAAVAQLREEVAALKQA